MKYTLTAAFTAATLLASSAAYAATVTETFTFGSNTSTLTSGTLSFGPQNGVSVTAGAYQLDGGGSDKWSVNSAIRLGQYSAGLGACSDLSGSCNSDNHQVDGNGDEIIMLSFSDVNGAKSVTLESATFGAVYPNDDFAFGVYSVISQGTGGVPSFFDSHEGLPTGTGPLDLASYVFGDPNIAAQTSSIFGFGATGYNDDYKLYSVTVSWDVPDDDMSPVPLPAAAWMLMAGVGGLGALKRRSKKKAA